MITIVAATEGRSSCEEKGKNYCSQFDYYLSAFRHVRSEKIMEPTEKEKQIAFLKEQEEIMSKYIKQESHSEIEIKYDWDSVECSQSMAFTSPMLAIKFDVIDKKKSSEENYFYKGNTLIIDVNKEYSTINDMWTTNVILE